VNNASPSAPSKTTDGKAITETKRLKLGGEYRLFFSPQEYMSRTIKTGEPSPSMDL
jgi:hypothetical protein